MKYILTIALGPVQGFIATARKTRDLWGGSTLLSELSKSAAKALKDVDGVELIFPGTANASDLDPDNGFSVANIVVCVVPEEKNPEDLTKAAKKAAYDRWNDVVKRVEGEIYNFGNVINVDFWNEQTNPEDLIEFYAAWVPITDENDVKTPITRAAKILAARKNCREFNQPDCDEKDVPKSSLDGARESVFKRDDKSPLRCELVHGETVASQNSRERLMLKKGEELDAIGLIKRLLKQNDRYPSLLETAITPILDQFGLERNLPVDDIESALERVDELDELDVAEFGEDFVNMINKIKEDGLYVAILVADGDQMGATLSKLTTKGDRQNFSRKLAKFSNGVRNIVEKTHNGKLVYAGGDDVLAFLPVDKAVACANDLRKSFKEIMTGFVRSVKALNNAPDRPQPSLSAGIAIVHYHETLEYALNEARKFEQIAKTPNKDCAADDSRYGNRNGVAIGLATRGNMAKVIRERWEIVDEHGLRVDKNNDPLGLDQDGFIQFLVNNQSKKFKIDAFGYLLDETRGRVALFDDEGVNRVYPLDEEGFRIKDDRRVDQDGTALDDQGYRLQNGERETDANHKPIKGKPFQPYKEVYTPIVDRLETWIKAFADERAPLPGKFPYDLYALVKSGVYDNQSWNDADNCAKALRADAKRIARQKENMNLSQGVGKLIAQRLDEIETVDELERFADELVIAKTIGDYQRTKETIGRQDQNATTNAQEEAQ